MENDVELDVSKVKRRPRALSSTAWETFVPSEDRKSAVCIICNRTIKTWGGQTSSLLRHLVKTHFVTFGLVEDDPASARRKKKKKKPMAKVKVKVKKKKKRKAEVKVQASTSSTTKKTTRQKRKLTSICWKYFTQASDRTSAVCKLCSSSLKIGGGSTTALMRHINSYHGRFIRDTEKKFQQGERKLKWESESEFSEEETDNEPVTQTEVEVENENLISESDNLQLPNQVQASTSSTRKTRQKRKLTSICWKYFTQTSDGTSAVCKLCSNSLKISGGSTTGLMRHLNSYHGRFIRDREKKFQISQGERKLKWESESESSDEETENEPVTQTEVKVEVENENLISESDNLQLPNPAPAVLSTNTKTKRWTRNTSKDFVWKYFRARKLTARCRICAKTFKMPKGGATVTLQSHLAFAHRERVKHESFNLLNLSNSLHSQLQRNEPGKSSKMTASASGSSHNEDDDDSVPESSRSSVLRKARRLRSAAWDYFTPDVSWEFGTCKICGAVIKICKGSTAGLLKHIRIKHNGNIRSRKGKMPLWYRIWEHRKRLKKGVNANADVNQDPPKVDQSLKNLEDDDDNDVGPEPESPEESDFTPAVNQSVKVVQCFLCHSSIDNKPLSSSSSSISKQLHVIFLLSKILRIPREMLKGYLKKFGNPEMWIHLCRQCDTRLDQAKKIYQDLLDASQKFRDLRKTMIEEVQEIQENQNAHELSDGDRHRFGFSIITENCWNYVRKYDYDGHFADPFIQGDLEATEKLKQSTLKLDADGKVKVEPQDEIKQEIEADSFFELEMNSDGVQNEALADDEDLDEIQSNEDQVTTSENIDAKDKHTRRQGDSIITCPLCQSSIFRTDHMAVLCQHWDECVELHQDSFAKSKEELLLTCPLCDGFKSTIVDRVRFAEHVGACTGSSQSQENNQISLCNRFFSCDICPDEKYLKFDQFIPHWLFHKKNIYKCTLCEKAFQHKDTVQSHLTSDHCDDPRITPDSPGWQIFNPPVPTVTWWCHHHHCSETFSSDDARDEHVEKCHPDFKRDTDSDKKCDWCPKQFGCEDELMLHTGTVHAALRNVCDICNTKFQLELNLKLHRMEVHGVTTLYKCHLCGYDISTNGSYKRHMGLHSEPRNSARICPICHKVCLNASVVQRHIGSEHQNRPNICCDVGDCTSEFNTMAQLTYHKAKIHNIGKFKCTVEGCSRVFDRRTIRDDHLARVHTKQFGFFCSVCGKGFYSHSKCYTHEQYFHCPPSFICDVCGKAFKTKSNLKQHQQFHKPKSTS